MSLLDHFILSPPSEKLAAAMNVEGRTVCFHSRMPCMAKCGVYFDVRERRAKPIPKEIRLDWLARMYHLSAPEELTSDRLRAVCGLYRLTKEWNDSYIPTSVKLGMR